MSKNEIKNYKIGLDIGTNSVGWACIGDGNAIVRHNGKLMWGSRLFDEAESKKNRRGFRATRRRLYRRRGRLNELNRIVKPEMDKVDPEFFNKMNESFLVREDRNWSLQFFGNKEERNKLMYIKDENNKAYQKNIYLIRKECMQDKQVDFRLVYLCLHHIMKYRGNFLYEDSQVENANGSRDLMIQTMVDLNEAFLNYCDCDLGFDKLSEQIVDKLLDQKILTKIKYEQIKDLLCDYQKNEIGSVKLSSEVKSTIENVVKLIVGYKGDLLKIFPTSFNENCELYISRLDDKQSEIEQALGEKYIIVELIAKINSAYTFNAILDGEEYISYAKVKSFYTHKEHLNLLKSLLKYENYKYFSRQEYEAMFNEPVEEVEKKSAQGEQDLDNKKKKIPANYYNYINNHKLAGQDEFYKFVRKMLDNRTGLDDNALAMKDRIISLIENNEFMPIQTTTENGAIPMQLHRKELSKIIDMQGKYYPVLKENKERLLKLFSFKIPYYYGPLNSESSFSWIVKTKDESSQEKTLNETINYLNFDNDDVVDKDETQKRFIERMLNTCEYLYGEKCMPKNSITCEMFDCLQELNGIKVDGEYLPYATKQNYIMEVLKSSSKIGYTQQGLQKFLASQEGYIGKENKISGTSENDKFNSSLKTFKFFTSEIGVPLQNIQANLYKFDELCRDMTIFKEGESRKTRLNKYISILPSNEKRIVDKVLKHKFDGWSRLSRKLVLGIKDSKGRSILDYLWEYDYVTESGKHIPPKLMNLIASDKYEFKAIIEEYQEKYHEANSRSLTSVIEESYCSPPVKRATVQAIKLVNEIVSILKCEPSRICVEFSSDSRSKEENNSRHNQLKKLYENIQKEVDEYNKAIEENDRIDLKELKSKLDRHKDKLSDEKVYLYFIQLGKSLYSGTPLNLDQPQTYEVDHIIPRSIIVDDSIDNKALVLKGENQDKKETCFVEYQENKYNAKVYSKHSVETYWNYLKSNKLMTEKKYGKLHADFRESGVLNGFINRQLVETRQAIKLVIELLKQRYPDEIIKDTNKVYHKVVAVNASLSSAYRGMNNIYKLRNVNDYHHAHDAYLAGVIGDFVYNKFDYLNDAYHYSAKTNKSKNYFYYKNIKDGEFGAIINLLRNDVMNFNTGESCWCAEWNKKIRETIYNEKCFISTKNENKASGEFWGATINKKADSKDAKLVAVNKKRSDISKYGGYTNQNMACSVIVKIEQKNNGKDVVSYKLQPIYKIDVARAKNHNLKLDEYINKKILKSTDETKQTVVAKLYENQLLEINGHPVFKNGDYYKNAKQLMLSEDICKFLYCIKDDKINYKVYAEKQKSIEGQVDNIKEMLYLKANEVYDNIINQFSTKYKNMLRADGVIKKLFEFKEKFELLALEQKIFIINNIFSFIRKGEFNFSSKGYTELGSAFGRVQIKSKDFNFSDKSIAIISKSVTGYYQNRKVVVNNRNK